MSRESHFLKSHGFQSLQLVIFAHDPARKKTMPKLLTLATGLLLAVGLSAASPADDAPLHIAGATTVDADAVIELITSSPNLVILDNRREADFEAGHIEGAVRLLDTDIEAESDIAAHVASLDTPVLFYCNGVQCGRASNAVTKAVGFGYTHAYYYANGVEEWRDLGLPLVTQ
jgi:rhodanese-related sulfurtransferase